MPKVILGRRYYFSAIHTIPQEDYIHGHDYSLDVSVSGSPNKAGWIMSHISLDRAVEGFVSKIDRKWVNDSIVPATGENLAKMAYENIRENLPKEIHLEKIELHETRKNSFTVLSQ